MTTYKLLHTLCIPQITKMKLDGDGYFSIPNEICSTFQGNLTESSYDESTPSSDVVREAILELIDGRAHEHSSEEQNATRLSVAHLFACLLVHSHYKDEEDEKAGSDFLELLPNMSERFIYKLVNDTKLTHAFVQVTQHYFPSCHFFPT